MRSRHLRAELAHREQRELRAMVEQPVEVEQPLIDDVLVGRPLVLDDDRAVVLVDPERVDAADRDLPVEYSEASNRTPSSVSRFRSMSAWSDFSTATELLGSSSTRAPIKRNSLMSLTPFVSQRGCDRAQLRQSRLKILHDLLGNHLGRSEVLHVLEVLVAQPGGEQLALVARHQLVEVTAAARCRAPRWRRRTPNSSEQDEPTGAGDAASRRRIARATARKVTDLGNGASVHAASALSRATTVS